MKPEAKQVNILMPAPEYAMYEALAASMGFSVTELIRGFVRDGKEQVAGLPTLEVKRDCLRSLLVKGLYDYGRLEPQERRDAFMSACGIDI